MAEYTQFPRQFKLSFTTITTLAFLLLASISAGFSLNPTRQFSLGKYNMKEEINERSRLGGPGSSPPRCRSKCNGCSPCKPVHVPIQPGFSIPLEYYPEAWRCKCGNTFFMP